MQAQGLKGWTSHAVEAVLRTPRGATPLHRDEWTLVANSTVEGFGLYAASKLPAAFVLYAYTGVTRTSAEAARRPNAFQYELSTGSVCDASNQKVASAARYVNTQGSYANDNNCLFKEHQGTVYLVTIKDIEPFEKLFAPYGIGDNTFPAWPLEYLGDPYVQVEEYKSYLKKHPTGGMTCKPAMLHLTASRV